MGLWTLYKEVCLSEGTLTMATLILKSHSMGLGYSFRRLVPCDWNTGACRKKETLRFQALT